MTTRRTTRPPDPTPAESADLLSRGDAAHLIGVSFDTFDRYVTAGLIDAYLLPSGHRRYRRADVLGLLRKASA